MENRASYLLNSLDKHFSRKDFPGARIAADRIRRSFQAMHCNLSRLDRDTEAVLAPRRCAFGGDTRRKAGACASADWEGNSSQSL